MSNPRAKTVSHMRKLMAAAAVAGLAATTSKPSSGQPGSPQNADAAPDAGAPDAAAQGNGAEGGSAASTGILVGVVIDAETGLGAPDVIVTLRSAALKGELIVVTDAAGKFRFTDLVPSSDYEVSVDSERYSSLVRKGLTVSAGNAAEAERTPIELKPTPTLGYDVVDPVPVPAGCGCRNGY